MVNIEDMSIKSIKKHLDRLENPKKFKVTHYPNDNDDELQVDNKWCASILKEEEILEHNSIKKAFSILYLATCKGQWYNQEGEVINGSLYYKPKEA